MTQPAKHKLTTVLFADIQGYTALMHRDESQALDLLNRFKAELERAIPLHEGKIIQYYGDGCLASFDSTANAAACSIVLQQAFQDEIPVRIGLHLGEVLFQENNIYGDAVNIASRIESMGVSGSVLLSGNVYEQIRNKGNFEFSNLGSYRFKNVEKPMAVFGLSNPGLAVPSPDEVGEKFHRVRRSPGKWRWFLFLLVVFILVMPLILWWGLPFLLPSPTIDKPTLLVLPFDNLNEDKAQDYFSIGLSDEIRGALASNDNLRVISKGSSVLASRKGFSPREVRRKLGADYVLDGSVFKEGDLIDIDLELSDVETNQIVWYMNTGRQGIEDLLKLQREISLEVATHMKVNIQSWNWQQVLEKYSDDPRVYDKFRQLLHKMQVEWNPGNYQHLIEEFRVFVDEHPDFVPALMQLGDCYTIMGTMGLSRDSVISLVPPLYRRAGELDPESRMLPSYWSFYLLVYEWDFKGAEAWARKGMGRNDLGSVNVLYLIKLLTGRIDELPLILNEIESVNPLHPFSRSYQARYLMFSGDLEGAREISRANLEEFPFFRDGYYDLGMTHLMRREYEEAAEVLEEGINTLGFFIPYLAGNLAIAYHGLGELEKFEETKSRLVHLWENGEVGSPAFYLGAIHSATGDREEAFLWLERAYENRDLEMIWLKMFPAFRPLKEDPRYQDLLRRVGFPERVVG